MFIDLASSRNLASSDEDADADEEALDEDPEEDDEEAAAAAAVFVVSTSELSCFSVCVRFLEASASARVSNFGL